MKFIDNPSFESHAGTAGSAFTDGTQLTSWTMSDYTKFTPISATTYRGYQGISSARSLQFTGNANITQALSNISARVKRYVPMYLQIAATEAKVCLRS